MDSGFIGAILNRERTSRLELGYLTDAQCWSWDGEEQSLFLRARGPSCRLFAFDAQAVLIQGVVVDTWSRHPRDQERLAARLHQTYIDQGVLTVDGLEGSFTLGLLDGIEGRGLFYRNLFGNGFLYYHALGDGLVFGSNLAAVVDLAGRTPRPCEEELPTFFLNRYVPGRNTLFDGHHRLLPGEQLQLKGGKLTTTQRRTLGDLVDGQAIRREALDRLDAVMAEICQDYAALDADSVNLLSGGVDSSFLQVHWNRTRDSACESPRTICVAVDHPRTRPDLDYALSASAAFATRHSAVPVNGPYWDYLLDTLSATGEMPNHVQLAYFPTLGRAMAAEGMRSGLTAEAADSLFGLSLANQLHNAALLRRLCPAGWLRRSGAAVAGFVGWERLRNCFDLAEHLYDQERPDHPVNRASVFADWPAVEECFGKQALGNAVATRRALLDHYHVPDTPMDRLHAGSYLVSALYSASLMTTQLNAGGVNLWCPFLDSRMLRLVVNLSARERFRFRNPKALLKRSLATAGHADLAYRKKLGFGQPVFEWLGEGGQLRPAVERIASYDFVDPKRLRELRDRPGWFLYCLLCYDIWHKLFVSRTIARPSVRPLTVAA